ncbi:hypothetical protein AXF42_Ash006141 [Apostasia shenzhenica]|uniref:Uncharacterized protein n=1 Tax=Apostasia shenzhenica TaxID=1088818 RepID=A0A2I0B0C2_9ASPA|nr:hypothetical protein AXF42_Ash006141 [Apostasia shenzhenica]
MLLKPTKYSIDSAIIPPKKSAHRNAADLVVLWICGWVAAMATVKLKSPTRLSRRRPRGRLRQRFVASGSPTGLRRRMLQLGACGPILRSLSGILSLSRSSASLALLTPLIRVWHVVELEQELVSFFFELISSQDFTYMYTLLRKFIWVLEDEAFVEVNFVKFVIYLKLLFVFHNKYAPV